MPVTPFKSSGGLPLVDQEREKEENNEQKLAEFLSDRANLTDLGDLWGVLEGRDEDYDRRLSQFLSLDLADWQGSWDRGNSLSQESMMEGNDLSDG